MNRAFVRTPFVLGVARFEMAPVIACEHDNSVFTEAGLFQRLPDCAHRLIHFRYALEVIGKLSGPRSR